MVRKTIKRQRTRQKKRQRKRQKKRHIGGNNSDSELMTQLDKLKNQKNKGILETIPDILTANNKFPNVDFTCKKKKESKKFICKPNNESTLEKIKEIGMEGLTEDSMDQAIELITEHIAKIPGISHIALLPKLYTVAKNAYKGDQDKKKLVKAYQALKASGLWTECPEGDDNEKCKIAADAIKTQMEEEHKKDLTEWDKTLRKAGQLGTATDEQTEEANCEKDKLKKWNGTTCLSVSEWTKDQCDKEWDSNNAAKVNWPPTRKISDNDALEIFNKRCVTKDEMTKINKEITEKTEKLSQSVLGITMPSKKKLPLPETKYKSGSPFGGKKKRKSRRKSKRKTRRKSKRKSRRKSRRKKR
jgi:hypothetical protein